MPSTSSRNTTLYVVVVGAFLFWLANRAGAQTLILEAGGPVKLTDEQKRMVALIQSASLGAQIDPAFMVALAVTESSLKPATIGDDGKSLGLFQLELATVHYWNPDATADELLDPVKNITWALLDMRKYFTDFPGFTYGDYAEAWTEGETGRFRRGRRNPQKVEHMQQALTDLGLTLSLNEVPT
jgi:hypothetical protein